MEAVVYTRGDVSVDDGRERESVTVISHFYAAHGEKVEAL